jgi:Holliday junction resolvase
MGFQNAGRAAPDPPGNGPLDAQSLSACCNLPNSAAGPAAQAKKRGGRASRDKGNRFERAIVILQDRGLGAEWVPISGSAGGSYSGDLTVPILGRDLVIEAKSRAKGFSQIYSWLQGRDALVIRADRRDAIAVLPLRLAAEIEGVLKSEKLDWHDFSAAVTALAPPARGPREAANDGAPLWHFLDCEERLQWLSGLASEPGLNQWSRSFVTSIEEQIRSGCRLSPKQLGCIDKILAAAWRRGVRSDARQRA